MEIRWLECDSMVSRVAFMTFSFDERKDTIGKEDGPMFYPISIIILNVDI